MIDSSEAAPQDKGVRHSSPSNATAVSLSRTQGTMGIGNEFFEHGLRCTYVVKRSVKYDVPRARSHRGKARQL